MVAPCFRGYTTWRRMGATTHNLGFPVVPWQICFHLTPFFWLVKRILIKVALVHVWGVTVVSEFGLASKNYWISLSWKRVDTVSIPPFQYLPGRRRNNNTIQVMWVTACCNLVIPWLVLLKVWRMYILRGWNLYSRGSSLL